MTREQRATQWRALVDQQAESRLSAAAFCREHGISLQRFYGWRRRFREQRSVENSARFVELVPCDQPHSGVRIRLGDTLSIEVQQGFDSLTLRAVIAAIDEYPTCQAWTCVNPGIQGSKPRCWLRYRVPDKSTNLGCVSGTLPF